MWLHHDPDLRCCGLVGWTCRGDPVSYLGPPKAECIVKSDREPPAVSLARELRRVIPPVPVPVPVPVCWALWAATRCRTARDHRAPTRNGKRRPKEPHELWVAVADIKGWYALRPLARASP